jgi:hypothetical protein
LERSGLAILPDRSPLRDVSIGILPDRSPLRNCLLIEYAPGVAGLQVRALHGDALGFGRFQILLTQFVNCLASGAFLGFDVVDDLPTALPLALDLDLLLLWRAGLPPPPAPCCWRKLPALRSHDPSNIANGCSARINICSSEDRSGSTAPQSRAADRTAGSRPGDQATNKAAGTLTWPLLKGLCSRKSSSCNAAGQVLGCPDWISDATRAQLGQLDSSRR